MTVAEIAQSLDAQALYVENPDLDIQSACGSDLMSDVLAFVKDKTVLLTGLTNPHVIRTAEMLDIYCIVFIRGKTPQDDLLEMAKERGIAVLTTKHTLYVACGMLYAQGLKGCERSEEGA